MLKSKSVWSGIIKIVTGVGLLCTGEQAAPEVIPEMLLAGWGIVDILIRLKTTKPISEK